MADIRYDADRRLYLLTTPDTGYAMRLVGDQDLLVHTYWGAVIDPEDAANLSEWAVEPLHGRVFGFDSPLNGREEYPVAGGVRFGQPALSARFAGGVRAVEWRFVDHEITDTGAGQELVLRFADRYYPLAIALYYRIREDSDVIERWAAVTNTAEPDGGAIELTRADSAAWALPPLDSYRLTHLVGRWSAETQLRQVTLTEGELVLGSRRGVTSHHANPWFAIDAGTATEETGEVYSGTLAWSGSWRIVADLHYGMPLAVVGGAGHESFGPYRLVPGETLTTPPFAGLFTVDGFGGASRAWHDYTLRYVMPNADKVRPVLYNSWEATSFDVNEANQRALARRAAALGCELFVVDDGWFGARADDHAGLGDWYVNTERFPNGLKPLIDEVHGLGMDFGIWVEPEMVNPDSDLYRAHPDWVYHFPERTRSQIRNQLVLNLARPDVAAWLHDWLHGLLTDNDIQFVKWDMNRPFTEAGWPSEVDNPDRLWLDHVRNLYAVLDRLRAEHPGVAFESCSGGGGRVDLGILRRTDQVWTSDNTDGPDRRIIQHGFSQLYPARAMSAWVTDVPNFLDPRVVPLRYRFHVAMAGVLGVGGDLTKWSEPELAEATDLIARYKEVRHIIQHGRLYRLRPPSEGLSAVQYVTPDRRESVVLAYLNAQRFGSRPAPLRLAGLDPDTRYRIDPDGPSLTGTALHQYGIPVSLSGDYDSTLITLTAEQPA
jgi:alpha-galactosidase